MTFNISFIRPTICVFDLMDFENLSLGSIHSQMCIAREDIFPGEIWLYLKIEIYPVPYVFLKIQTQDQTSFAYTLNTILGHRDTNRDYGISWIPQRTENIGSNSVWNN